VGRSNQESMGHHTRLQRILGWTRLCDRRWSCGILHRIGNQRIDTQSVRAVRVTGLRPTFGRISRYGVMALSWTQDRLGPMCRYAEDCAIVMQAVAKTDSRDMSVSEIPFNWNAQLDIRKLRIGYIKESFEDITNPAAKAAAQKVLDTLMSLGVSRFTPVSVPEWPYDGSAINVESAVFFDELVRSGGVSRMTNPGRAAAFKNARLVPAVEYLQSQRARNSSKHFGELWPAGRAGHGGGQRRRLQ